MCNTCGCNVSDWNRQSESVAVLKGLLDANDLAASHNREHLDRYRTLAVNLMSSPGAGKTSLLEATILRLASEFSIAVVEGDLETENDAERIRATGVPAKQICTGTACHLDAHMVHVALHELELPAIDLLFIENVGNLVCPASFDLGQHLNVTLLSTPEGDDKPAKYPVMFRTADLMLLSKSDLLDVLGDFAPERATTAFRALANPAPVIELSSRTGEGMDHWVAWIRTQLAAHRERLRDFCANSRAGAVL